MKETPLISVVMPVYNSAKHLAEAIRSVLSQKFTDFEFIIADDGSTDKSVEIIRSFRDERIKSLELEHNYIVSCNRCVSTAKGKYIVRMDSDDIMLPGRLEKQFAFMENNPEIDISGTWMRVFGTVNQQWTNHTSDEMIKSTMLLRSPLFHPTVIIKRELINHFKNENGYYSLYSSEYSIGEDYKLWTDLARLGVTFANLPEILHAYRKGDGQITQIRKKEREENDRKIQMEYTDFVLCKIKERWKDKYVLFKELSLIENEGKISNETYRSLLFHLYKSFLISQPDNLL